ncbi:hypothetical protein [Parapedobacter sp. 10938]|uniref:hypothetical protein n=1 Tax=Parapedobacter flavus TaxID=3110225 RepID=UPI002DB9B6B2|nr:hypothetical protein [Parapedobacter sp. 10938]MEC3882069.1 hypothetical protein [Parapedobacter sp. 10938]
MPTFHTVPLVKSIDEYVPGQTFEQLVVSRLQPFFGRSIRELCTAFLVSYKVDQPGIYRKLTKAILGIPLDKKIEEFEKGDVHIRMVYTHEPQYPKRQKRYLLWHVDHRQTEPYLHKIEFWTPAVSDTKPFLSPALSPDSG